MMKSQNEIGVFYKNNIPDDWFNELESAIQTNNVKFSKAKDDGEYDNFTGPEFSDIIIFIRDNPESIFLAPALYDILKSSIVGLWNRLTNLYLKKSSSENTDSKQKKISIRYEDPEQRRVIINIEGELDNNIIEKIVEESLEIIKTEKKEEYFQQPDLVDNSQGNDIIELKYNSETKNWEPENFGEIRRKMENLQKWANENFDA